MNADDLNFDDIPAFANLPPLDPWRKIRRELLQHINKSRHEEHGSLQDVYPDNIAQIAA